YWLQFSVPKWLVVVPIAAATWVVMVALAALCMRYMPRLPYQLVSLLLFALGVGVFLARNAIGRAVVEAIDHSAPSLNLLLPTGWVPSLFRLFLPDPHWSSLVLLFPIAGLLWLARGALLSLRSNYLSTEPIMPEQPDLLPGEPVEAPAQGQIDPEKPLRV